MKRAREEVEGPDGRGDGPDPASFSELSFEDRKRARAERFGIAYVAPAGPVAPGPSGRAPGAASLPAAPAGGPPAAPPHQLVPPAPAAGVPTPSLSAGAQQPAPRAQPPASAAPAAAPASTAAAAASSLTSWLDAVAASASAPVATVLTLSDAGRPMVAVRAAPAPSVGGGGGPGGWEPLPQRAGRARRAPKAAGDVDMS